MLLFRPLMIEDIPITVATPMTTPNKVRIDLSVFLRSESRARRKISLIAERHDGIQVCGFGCRINSKEQTNAGRDAKAQSHSPPFDGSRQRSQPRNRQGD